MTFQAEPDEGLTAVPLFPLPNVVLYPRAALPLHIFEERYKVMTRHALAGDRQIAMALLKTGWEKNYSNDKNYYARPDIEPVVCVGKIVSHEKLADGRYNFLLVGQWRGTIVREAQSAEPYRTALLQPLQETPLLEIDLSSERRRLMAMFDDSILASSPIGRQFRELLYGATPTDVIADLIAFHLLEDVGLKQALLAEPDVRARVERVVSAIEAIRPVLEAACRKYVKGHSVN